MKDGKVTDVIELDGECNVLKEAGDRIVAVVGDYDDSRVAVYKKGDLLHACRTLCGNWHSLTVHNSKAYFASQEGTKPNIQHNLIEFDLTTFEERQVLANVWTLSGVPGEQSFVAITQDGLVHASAGRVLDLSKVFEKMNAKECTWTTVLSLGRFALVAGWASHDISDGNQFEFKRNFFLLLKLSTLLVVKQIGPLTAASVREGTSVV